MSCPLHFSCSNDPGRKAEFVADKVCGLDATGQSLGNGLARFVLVATDDGLVCRWTLTSSSCLGLVDGFFLTTVAFLRADEDPVLAEVAMVYVWSAIQDQSTMQQYRQAPFIHCPLLVLNVEAIFFLTLSPAAMLGG